MNRTWERLALIGAAVIIIASAIFYVYVDRFPSTNTTRIEDTKVNADGILPELFKSARGTRTRQSAGGGVVGHGPGMAFKALLPLTPRPPSPARRHRSLH